MTEAPVTPEVPETHTSSPAPVLSTDPFVVKGIEKYRALVAEANAAAEAKINAAAEAAAAKAATRADLQAANEADKSASGADSAPAEESAE